ncbi:MAG: putative bifunctional diguanylate cyclase/phosphodiesterase [bacterium]
MKRRSRRAAGDKLLCFYAARTQEHLSKDEAVCRINADRFAVLSHAEGEDGLREGQKEVLDSVRHFFTDQGKENRVLICGGIYVLTPEDYREINVYRMLDYARMAEKRAWENQNDGYAVYNPEQWEKGKRMADIINRLPLAITAGELKVWYQPQVDFRTGKLFGAEALCRWDHDKLGWLQPYDFMTTLEESGLIYDLDCFVWDKVCQDLQRWKAEGHKRFASVNVSRVDFNKDRDIPEHFHRLVEKYGLSPDQLRIEITETAFVERPELLISATKKLQSLGFEVEMDDFGSGNSSLHMLKEVPIDRIKLDLHFLTDSGDQEKSRIIVSYMIQMVLRLGLEMIAEGVETIDQARFLESKGCTLMQGYHFYKPMPVEKFEKLCECYII